MQTGSVILAAKLKAAFAAKPQSILFIATDFAINITLP